MIMEDQQKSPYLIPGAIIVAGIIIALAIVYTSGGGRTIKKVETPTQQQEAAATASNEAEALLEAGPADSVLGKPTAPVTFVEFGDFQCPFCGRFFDQTLPQIKDKYVKTGKVKFIWRDFAFLGKESFDAAQAARCAGEQGKFWEYHDYLFGHQNGENEGAFVITNLKNFATALGLNKTQFNSCLDSGKYLSAVQKESELGRELGVTGTPSSFINGHQITGALPFASIEAVILDALNKN